MANYIKIRDLSSYSTNAGGVVTGIYTGDYMALASRLPANGGLESVQNTRKAAVADVIRLYNEAQTIADAVAASDGSTPEQIANDLANPNAELPATTLTTAYDTEAGECRVVNDPSLTARTFGSIVKLGGGLTYEAKEIDGSADVGDCKDYQYTLGLTPSTDVESSTFILFIGRNEYLDDASNYGVAGPLLNWTAGQNALTDTNSVTNSPDVATNTGNYLLYGSGNQNGATWGRASVQGPVWSGLGYSVADAVNVPRSLINTNQVLESGVMDSSPGDNEVTTLEEVLKQIYGYANYSKAKCVANPFVSLNAACDYATRNFDLPSSTIIYWIRGDGPQGNMRSFADELACIGSPMGTHPFNHKQTSMISPVAGKPRKINYYFGPVTSTDDDLNQNPIADRTLVWSWAQDSYQVTLTNVHFKLLGLGASQDLIYRSLYLFRYAGTSNTRWDNSIIDWSDQSNARSVPTAIVANQLHQPYNSAAVNFDASFALFSSGMRHSIPEVGFNRYEDYSRFRPAVEYITNKNVNLNVFMNQDNASLVRQFTFNPHIYAIGPNKALSSLHAWQRFRDGTAGVNPGFYFGSWNVMSATCQQLHATPIVAESVAYRNASYVTYAHTNRGTTNIMLGSNSLSDSPVPFEPSAALGFEDALITISDITANGCTGYGVAAPLPTGSQRPMNYLGDAYNGADSCIRQTGPTNSTNLTNSNLIKYPPSGVTESGPDGWVGRITGGYGPTLLNGIGAVPNSIPPSGSGPLLRRYSTAIKAQDTADPGELNGPLFSGMMGVDNTVVKYLDDPYPYYTTHI